MMGADLLLLPQVEYFRQGLNLLADMARGGLVAGRDLWHVHGGKLAGLVGLFAALVVVRSVALGYRRYLMVAASHGFTRDLRQRIFDKLTRLSPAFYDRWRKGDLLSRITSDVNNVRWATGPSLMFVAKSVWLLLVAIIGMVAISPRLTLWVLLVIPLTMGLTFAFSRAFFRRNAELQEAGGHFSSQIEEGLSGIRLVKAFGREGSLYARFDEHNGEVYRRGLRLVVLRAWFNPLIDLTAALRYVILLAVGGAELSAGRLDFGGLAAFIFWFALIDWPTRATGWVASMLIRGEASMARIDEILGAPEDIGPPAEPLTPRASGGEIRFEGVSFRYGPDLPWVLRDVSFTARAGEHVGLAGAVGTGKTTVLRLVLRLYDATEGRVLVDGQDVRDWNPQALRARLGYVSQEPFLFSASLADNLAFGADPRPDRETIRRAAADACLDDDVAALADGYDTLVGERGVTLSGGQKQRATIARALLRRPAIMLLDDCLSAVDSETADRLQNNLDRELRHRTTLVVAQRVDTLERCDRLVVLDGGAIAETGTPAALREAGGVWARLIAERDDDETDDDDEGGP